MESYNNNVKTLNGRKPNVVRYLLLVVLLPLLPLAFLLDLIWFFLVKSEECLHCGWEDIVAKGIFTRIIINKIE